LSVRIPVITTPAFIKSWNIIVILDLFLRTVAKI
jgi:hypothetical protein